MKHQLLIREMHFDRRLSAWQVLEDRRVEAERLLVAWLWKSGLEAGFPTIACLIGGTGTGKSTLFNSLAGRELSEVGAKRPCTLRAVALAPEDAVTQLSECPFLDFRPGGNAELVLQATDEPARIILVDAPDFDSVEGANRLMAENLFVLSDLLMFVTSQEKYADLTAHQMAEAARAWGKASIFIMNKVASVAAFHDFRTTLKDAGYDGDPTAVERVDNAPNLLPGLREQTSFKNLAQGGEESSEALREAELHRLSTQTHNRLQELVKVLESLEGRIRDINERIDIMVRHVTEEMRQQLDAVLSEDIESRVRERLQKLLRKYDILFVPRMMVRNALRTTFGALVDLVSGRPDSSAAGRGEQDARTEDFEATRSAVNLKPVETAAARLNFKIAELLASDPSLDDLRQVGREDVKRFDAQDVQSQYDNAFPGVEHLLEEEFKHFREGLSAKDELKLYGSYTLWALLLITAEIVVGGGFTLLDALLNTVIVPFIPKWLLNLKVLDVLREIGRRVDNKHRQALTAIVEKQADFYVTAFRGLLPDERNIRHIESLMEDIGRSEN